MYEVGNFESDIFCIHIISSGCVKVSVGVKTMLLPDNIAEQNAYQRLNQPLTRGISSEDAIFNLLSKDIIKQDCHLLGHSQVTNNLGQLTYRFKCAISSAFFHLPFHSLPVTIGLYKCECCFEPVQWFFF
ncbi:hypothetical protein WUBG_11132 [Wuchereria bancrofti]|nr:hypothetical protein WUBG_11132 [Wuchereria bancrofti]